MTHAWLIGGSGLVGSLVEAKLAGRGGLVSFGRRSPTANFQRQIDFERLPAVPAEIAECDTAISCLGTTIKTAGSEAAMRRVDHDYVVAFAAAAKAHGARQFILVSSAMANEASGNFYLRLKGETERDIRTLDFDRVDIVRPGLLLGDREEIRPGERLGALLSPILNPLLIGRLYKYRAITAETVATAIEALVGANEPRVFVHENRRLQALAST